MRADKLSPEFVAAINEATSLAAGREHQIVEPVHLMVSLLAGKDGTVRRLLTVAGGDMQRLRGDFDDVLNRLPTVSGTKGDIRFSSNMNRAFNVIDRDTQHSGAEHLSPELLPAALFEIEDPCAEAMRRNGITVDSLKTAAAAVAANASFDGEDAENGGFLEQYTIDITEQARQGKLDPVIGRDDEVRRTIQVLQRRTKNNPVLIGEPGVGKTAIVEGLADRIVHDQVPEGIRDKTVLSLDLGALVAGTKFRGEFEERFKGVLKELANQSGDIILFIDEVHTLVGAGRAEGSMDAGNMLKPALARGELHCVGATTLDEYRENIEKDAALERRFLPIQVDEPNVEDTIAILRGLKERYELHHGVAITDPAIVAAATLSYRYISDRRMPDKAIDLVDEAASRIRLERDSKPEELDRLEQRLVQLKMEREVVSKESDSASKERLATLQESIASLESQTAKLNETLQKEKAAIADSQHAKERLEQARFEYDKAQRNGDLARMSELKYGEIPVLERAVSWKDSHENTTELQLLRTRVTEDEIADVVAAWTGIPVASMMQGEQERLLHMETNLHKRVVGQNEAVDAISDAIRRARSGLADPERPNGSFLFLGPTGVGKTELTRALSEFLFDTESAMVRIDMSEYMEKHSVSRLIGAPPGYVGFDEGGQLTEIVRRKPYSVILLDEIEKAHQDVFSILLQVLDDGRLTDGHGRTVDFRNTVIVMTSNLGSQLIQEGAETDSYAEMKESVMNTVKGYFRPEFLNRIDEVVVFRPLVEDEIRDIAAIQVGRLVTRVADQQMLLTVTEDAISKIAEGGFDTVYGARPLKRAIQQKLENPLAHKLLSGEFKAGQEIVVEPADSGFAFRLGARNYRDGDTR